MYSVVAPSGYQWSSPLAYGERASRSVAKQSSNNPLLAPTPQKLLWAGEGPGVWRGTNGGSVQMQVPGEKSVTVEIDRKMGPLIICEDGSADYMPTFKEGPPWYERSSADQKVLVFQAAQQNAKMPELVEQYKARAAERAELEKFAAMTPAERIAYRCNWEQSKRIVTWTPISMEQVTSNHNKRSRGIIYGIEFPWNEDTLEEFGASWLTEAFHMTKVMPKNNRVTEVRLERDFKIDAGNNGGKFLFSVSYAKPDPDLHEKLFVKCAFSMSKETKSDRISSSVYKQPMDFHEVNTFRLLPGVFPMDTPKYYFGDISTSTSNFIIITARIPFADIDGKKETLKPYEVEGPNVKCKDFQLRSDPKEYYTLLVKISAQIAGWHKAGKMGDERLIRSNFGMPRGDPLLVPRAINTLKKGDPQSLKDSVLLSWGVDPTGFSGGDVDMVTRTTKVGLEFMAKDAKVLFPDYVTTHKFQADLLTTILKFKAYESEIELWKHHDMAYVALGHANLNADNGYFWRDDGGNLCAGALDWGGFGTRNLPHVVWWMLNCADHENVKANLDTYIDVFISTYQEYGGPALDRDVFKMMVFVVLLGNLYFMILAVPNVFTMCKKEEWATIKDKHDPRIAGNISGKSTLRTTLHVMLNAIRVLQEMEAAKSLDQWIEFVFVQEWGLKEKGDDITGISSAIAQLKS